MSAGLHSVTDDNGKIHYFFLAEGEDMPKKYLKVFLNNLDANIEQVPKDQREDMRRHAEEIKKRLK